MTVKKKSRIHALGGADTLTDSFPPEALEHLRHRGMITTKKSLASHGIKWSEKTLSIVFQYYDSAGNAVNGMEQRRKFRRLKGGGLVPVGGKVGSKFKLTAGHGNPPMFDPAKDYSKPGKIMIGESPVRMYSCHDNLKDIACIGVNGVNGWVEKDTHNTALHPELSCLEWEGKTIYLAFDQSDKDKKGVDGVQKAQAQLARVLLEGHQVKDVFIMDWDNIQPVPNPNGRGKLNKPGLDDLLYAHKYKSIIKMQQDGVFKNLDYGDIEDASVALEIRDMNNHVALVKGIKKYFRLDGVRLDETYTLDAHLCSLHEARDMIYADHMYETRSADGAVRQHSTFNEWNKWPRRNVYESIIYEPGQGRDVVVSGGVKLLNTWQGWGVEPVKGDVQPFLDMVDHIFTDQPKGHKEYFLKWLAYPIQNPGASMFVSYLLYSPKRDDNKGIGKTFIAYVMGDIYGFYTNFAALGNKHLHSRSDFNGYMANKQFILFDEVLMSGSTEKRKLLNQKLKEMVTQESINIRLMRTNEFPQARRYNIMMTSDQEDALYIDIGERRFAVVDIKVGPKPRSFYDRVDKWRKKQNGPAHLFHYLLHDVDCTGFNPSAPSPFTIEGIEKLVEQSKGDEDLFAEELWFELKSTSGVKQPCEVYLASYLTDRCNENRRVPKSANAVSRALGKVGCVRKHISVDGEKLRMIAMTNFKYWEKADNAVWVAEWRRVRRRGGKQNG